MSELGEIVMKIAEKNRQREKIKPMMGRSNRFNETIIYLCAKFKEQGFLTIPSGIKELSNNVLNITSQGAKNIIANMERYGLIEKRKIEGRLNQEAYFPVKNNGHMIIIDYLEDALINQAIELRTKEKILDDMKKERKDDNR
jgi:hypothetical protein